MDIGIIDFLILAVIALVTWCVSAEGAIGAGTTFISVLIGGILAMNFFEPLADQLDNIAIIGPKADIIALVGLFAAFTTGMRLACEKLSPVFININPLAHDIARWGFGVLTGYLTAGILLAALHTAPLPRSFIGFEPQRNNLFDVTAPDRQWLGFMQYVTERPYSKMQIIRDPEVGDLAVPRVFDGRTAYHWYLHRHGGYEVLQKANVTTAAPGDPKVAQAATHILMPTFIIRYADRRAQLYGGGAPASSAPLEATAPPSGPNF